MQESTEYPMFKLETSPDASLTSKKQSVMAAQNNFEVLFNPNKIND